MSVYKDIGIYRITNLKNNKSYIGKTELSFGDRWDSHRALLRGNKHYNSALQEDWNRYGEENFEFAILEKVDSAERLNELEIKYISAFRDREQGYNIHDGGDIPHMLGKHLSEETKRKIGEKNRTNMMGRKASEETKRKMSEAQIKRYESWTEEDRAAWGKMVSEKVAKCKWSDEAKRRFSQKQQICPNGAKFSPEDIRQIRSKRAGGSKLKDLATEYNTSETYISSIVHYRRWANI